MARAPRRRRRVVEMEVVVVAIDSNYEPVTKAAHDYRQQHVYPYLEGKGFTVVRCQGPLARRHYVASEARKPNVDYLTGVGHGSYDTYTGDWGDPIFRVGNYSLEESRAKIVHFLSCQTARDLGPDFVSHGCRAYFGYDVNFAFLMDYAGIFFECDSEIDRAFAEGLTAQQVYERVRALYDQHIAQLRAAGKDYVAATLQTDRDHLCAPSLDARWGSRHVRLE